MGRPTKLSTVLQTEICGYLEKGIPQARAAALAGISGETFRQWYNRGLREPVGMYGHFRTAVDLAEAKLHATVADMLMSACAHNPKLLLAWMGRRFPEEFGRRDNVEVQSPEDKAANEQALRDLLMERLQRYAPLEDAEVVPALPAGAADV